MGFWKTYKRAREKSRKIIKREEGYEFRFYLEPHENHMLAFISTYTENIAIQSLNMDNYV